MTKAKNTVLIAEDESPLRGALVSKFSNSGFNVIEAKNGQEALDNALEKHPDIILMDVIMPKKHGIEVVELIRKDVWGKDVPIIFVTNLSNDSRLKDVIDRDRNCDYIVKSNIKLDELVGRVKSKLL
ncbi:MAG: response regulator [Patescibacteria group bacterium]|jgi:DNA-binding response OmpR family regulator